LGSAGEDEDSTNQIRGELFQLRGALTHYPATVTAINMPTHGCADRSTVLPISIAYLYLLADRRSSTLVKRKTIDRSPARVGTWRTSNRSLRFRRFPQNTRVPYQDFRLVDKTQNRQVKKGR